MTPLLWRYLLFPALLLGGALFSWRLANVPSRMEAAAFTIAAFLVPTLKYPKFGVYYLFCVPFLVPLFRRLYYLIADRPTVDYLMLVSDGVMCGFIAALLLLWMINKEKPRDRLSALVVVYVVLLFLKVFLGTYLSVMESLYGFKFNGLYVMFFFAGSYVLLTASQTRRVMGFASWVLLFTALWGVKQIVFGFSGFEQKWIDSITFTTLKIDGVVRPFSTYVSPAAMSDGMTILFLIAAYWIMARGRHMILFGLMLAGAAAAPLLMATVRTNWLATAAGLFFFFVFLRLRRGWTKAAVLCMMLVGVGFMAFNGDSASEAQSVSLSSQMSGAKDRSLSQIMIANRTRALANPLQEYSVQKRLQIWGNIWYYALRHPLGRGQGTTGYAHSYYFQVLGEIGFPGLVVFLLIVGMTFHRGFRVIARSPDPETVELTRLLLSIVFALSVLNLTGTHLHTSPGDIFFWFSLGAISRFHRQLDGAPAAGTPDQAAAPAPVAAALAGGRSDG